VSFRRRLTLLVGAAVAVAILLASTLAYVTIGEELRDQVDASLLDRGAEYVERRPGFGRGAGGPFRGPGPFGRPDRPPPRRRGGFDFYEQVVSADGAALAFDSSEALPVDADVRAVAAGERDAFVRDATLDGDDVRLLVAPLKGGGAVQIARSLAEVDSALDRIRLILLLVALGGVAVAALLGRLVAGRAVAPLRRLNEMFDALQGSMRAQRQLIADASHELRTPVTSLRTNIEVLQRYPDLDPGRRTALLDRATAQAEELTVLMNDLIELARGDEPEEEREPVRLDELVEEAVERAWRHAPHQRFDIDLAEATVLGSPRRLARAVNNLLDNAVAFSPDGSPIVVRLGDDGTLTVRDHGPGFADGEVEHVFDRFFRGAHTRERSGSGLGLAIVRQVASSHGGSATAAAAPGGGALLTLHLPRR
jgi:two-component system, OmpR family, sensor histidine kinase MprB